MSANTLKFYIKYLAEDLDGKYQSEAENVFHSLQSGGHISSFDFSKSVERPFGTKFESFQVMTVSCFFQSTNSQDDRRKLIARANKLWCEMALCNEYLQWLEPERNYFTGTKFIPVGDFKAGEIAFGTISGMKDFVQRHNFRAIKVKEGYISSIICCFDHLRKNVNVFLSSKHKPQCEHTGEMGFKLSVNYNSVVRILADTNTKKDLVEFYLVLKHPPLISVAVAAEGDEDTELRARVCKAKELSLTSAKFERNFHIGCTCNNTLRKCKQIGKNFVLKMVADDKYQVRVNLEQFSQVCSKRTKVCYTSVCTHNLRNMERIKVPSMSAILYKSCLSDMDRFNCEYAWAVLQSQSDAVFNQVCLKSSAEPTYIMKFRETMLKLAEANPQAFSNSLYLIADLIEKGTAFDFLSHLEKQHAYFSKFHWENKLPPGMTYVRRLVITPSRTVFLQPLEHFENRIIRHFGPEFMIRASVKEDDYSKLTYAVQYHSRKNEIMQEIVGSALIKGIKIGSRQYEFLAASNSQLREHGFWMYAKDKDGVTAPLIREWMGDFSAIKIVSKYMARMGQCLSSIEAGVQVAIDARSEKLIPDVKTKNGKYTFSDGIGKISSELAKEIRLALDKNPVNCNNFGNGSYEPVAFQIRYKGCKGMVVEYPESGRKLYIRPSMKKFECHTSNNLEIVKASGPTKLFLNKHLITILEQMGIHQEVFLRLEMNMISKLLDSLVKEIDAAKQLMISLPGTFSYEKLLQAGFSFTADPFFRSLLLANLKVFAVKLKTKMRISISSDYGRNMLAVLDETKTLKYGQVFVQYSKSLTDPQAGFEILKGPVVVTKNPSLHPGDVRKLTAIDVPQLHHIKDCIVFPAKGRRPHADEMAGSDMDGDEMVVLWYEPLIFKEECFPPMDYPQYQESGVISNIQLSDMVNFFCQYIQNDNIGIFANAHLVWADRLKDGIFSKKCMNIAKKYPYVLDFAKQGTTKVLEKSERPYQYPEFLEKGLGGNTYHSEKVLGSLYRTARVLEACCSKIKLSYNSHSYDPDLNYPGWECYKLSAEAHLHEYNMKMIEILDRYGLSSEAEAFAGMISEKIIDQKTSDVAKVLNKYLQAISHHFKIVYFRELEEECKEKKLDKEERLERMYRRASSWYMVTYQQNEPKVLSFPWVLSDILATIKMRNSSPSVQNALLQNLDDDITEWSKMNKKDSGIKTCFCNNMLEQISFVWIAQSGLNIGQDVFCDVCYQRIIAFFNSQRNVVCCSLAAGQLECTCMLNCSPAKLLLYFLNFFFSYPIEKSLGKCNREGCCGFLTNNLQELSLQTYCYIIVTQNIYYLGLPFHTKSSWRNSLVMDMFDEGYGEPVKIIINNSLKEMVENQGEEICSFLKKCSGVQAINLTPVKNSMCLIVLAYGKNWQRWNLQKILLDTNITTNLEKSLKL